MGTVHRLDKGDSAEKPLDKLSQQPSIFSGYSWRSLVAAGVGAALGVTIALGIKEYNANSIGPQTCEDASNGILSDLDNANTQFSYALASSEGNAKTACNKGEGQMISALQKAQAAQSCSAKTKTLLVSAFDKTLEGAPSSCIPREIANKLRQGISETLFPGTLDAGQTNSNQ